MFQENKHHFSLNSLTSQPVATLLQGQVLGDQQCSLLEASEKNVRGTEPARLGTLNQKNVFNTKRETRAKLKFCMKN